MRYPGGILTGGSVRGYGDFMPERTETWTQSFDGAWFDENGKQAFVAPQPRPPWDGPENLKHMYRWVSDSTVGRHLHVAGIW